MRQSASPWYTISSGEEKLISLHHWKWGPSEMQEIREMLTLFGCGALSKKQPSHRSIPRAQVPRERLVMNALLMIFCSARINFYESKEVSANYSCPCCICKATKGWWQKKCTRLWSVPTHKHTLFPPLAWFYNKIYSFHLSFLPSSIHRALCHYCWFHCYFFNPDWWPKPPTSCGVTLLFHRCFTGDG